jgi:hypothetical protein
MDDQFPGGIKSGDGRLRLPELDIKGPIKVLQPSFSLYEVCSHG